MTLSVEEHFVATIDELDLPDVDLVTAVMTRAIEPPAAWRPRLAIAIAIIVVVVGLTLAVEPAREAVADWLGLGTTKVEIVPNGELSADLPANAETRPTPPSTDTTDATDDSVDGVDSTGPDVPNPIPELGPPVAVDEMAVARGRRFTWPAGADLAPLADTDVGAILSVRGAEGELDLKRLLGETELEFLTITIGGAEIPALWIGADHEYVAAGSDGPVLSDNVLVWVVDGVQYRLEADLSLAAATKLALATEGGTDLLRPG